MVAIKNLFFATSLLLGGAAAALTPTETLDVAVVEAGAEVPDLAIDARAVKPKPATTPKPASTPKPATGKKCGPKKTTKRSRVQARALFAGKNANQILENEFVDAMQVKNNAGKATVVDLSGCTALFFYMDTTLRRVVHVQAGKESVDAKTAASAAAGADSVTIGAMEDTNANNARDAILAAKPALKINPIKKYSKANIGSCDVAVTLSGASGSTSLTEGTGPKISKEQ